MLAGCGTPGGGLAPVSRAGADDAQASIVAQTATPTAQELIAALARSDQPIDADCPQGSVVAFGDSITEGLYLTGDEAYPAKLAAMLGVPVCNAGSLGDTTTTAMLRLQRDVLQFHPSVVLVLFGTNDSGVTAHDGRSPVPIEQYRATLTEIATASRAAGGVPVLLSLPPTDPTTSAPGGTGIGGWAIYDAGLRDVARSEGVELVDLAAAFGGDLSLLGDGIHPTPEGAARIAQAAAPVVRADVAGR